MNETTVLKVLLKGLTDDFDGMNFHIGKDAFLIGRHINSDLKLTDKTISSKHAQIIKQEGYYKVEDLDSSNGTFVNDTRISNSRLRTGDVIAFHKIKFRFVNPFEDERTEITDGEAFRESMKTFTADKELEKGIGITKDDTAPLPVNKIRALRKITPGLFLSGLIFSLAVSFLVTLVIPFLIRLIQITPFNTSAVWNLVKGQLIGFPFFHSHLYWTLSVNIDLLYILAGICIPVGLALGGALFHNRIGGGRLKNAVIFSLFYVIFGLFFQLAVLEFSSQTWVAVNSGMKFGMTGIVVNFAITMIYFWLVSFLFTLTGAFISRR